MVNNDKDENPKKKSRLFGGRKAAAEATPAEAVLRKVRRATFFTG